MDCICFGGRVAGAAAQEWGGRVSGVGKMAECLTTR